MTRPQTTSLVVTLIAVAIAVAAASAVIVIGSRQAGITAPMITPPLSERTPTGSSSLSTGESIYRYGVSTNGAVIPRTTSQGSGKGMMRGMLRGGCATCHGSDGRGRTTMMFAAPDITYVNLSDPAGMVMPNGDRDETYTDVSLRRAITTGVDPSGEELGWPMPRWELTTQEWEGLLTYLKTLP